MLFGDTTGERNANKLSHFLREPYNDWGNALRDFRTRKKKSPVHSLAEETQLRFTDNFISNKNVPIDLQLNAQNQVEENRKKTDDYFKNSVILCEAKYSATRT